MFFRLQEFEFYETLHAGFYCYCVYNRKCKSATEWAYIHLKPLAQIEKRFEYGNRDEGEFEQITIHSK